jgi:hypothetical protein
MKSIFTPLFSKNEKARFLKAYKKALREAAKKGIIDNKRY